MKNLKKAIKRTICMLLTVAMLCADTGVTAYAAEGAGQKILEETVEETLTGNTQAEEVQEEAVQAEDAQTGEASKENEQTESDLTEEGETGESSPEETLVEGETLEKNFGEENTETGATEQNPAAEDGTTEDNPDVEDAENTGDAAAEEAVSEDDVDIEEDTEENLETAAKASGDNIASGEYKENGNDITWVIDADGKLTVEGDGDFSASSAYADDRAPWYEQRMSIKSAEINVTGMSNAASMFYGCSNMTSVDLSRFDTSKVKNMWSMFSDCSSLISLDLSNFDTSNVINMSSMFRYCSSLTSLDISNFATGNVIDMSSMFFGCSNLISLDLSNFDTSNVTSMRSMFAYCSSLTILDVCSFDTSKVANMGEMFWFCVSLTSLDLRGFDVSKVIDPPSMFTMFTNCTSLIIINTPLNLTQSVALPVESMDIWYKTDGTEIVELPKNLNYSIVVGKNKVPVITSAITVTKAKTTYSCEDTISIDDLTVTYYDESGIGVEVTDGYLTNVDEIDMSTVGNKILKITYNGMTAKVKLTVKRNVSGSYRDVTWVIDADGKLTVEGRGDFLIVPNVIGSVVPWGDYKTDIMSVEINVTDMTDASGLFSGCKYLTSINLEGFDTSKVTNMGNMFADCNSLTSLDLSNFDTSKVTNMGNMFADCSSLTSLDLSNFDTSSVTYVKGMFRRCISLASLELSSLNTSKVTNMEDMFYLCSSLTDLELGSFDTSKVINLSGMFDWCDSLISLELGSFDTSSVTDMSGMFRHCISLTSLELGNFNTSNVTSMYQMFCFDRNLISLDLSSFDTSNVTDMGYMFYDCSSLKSLDLRSFDVGNVTDKFELNVFPNINALITIHTPYNLKQSVALPSGTWYQPDGTEITELPQNLDHSILIKKNEIPIVSAIKAAKTKTDYVCGDAINLDDLTITYYDANGIAQELGSDDYTTNEAEIDMSTEGEKTLVITYGGLTTTIELTVAVGESNIIASGEYKENGNDITWVIDADGKLIVEGTGNFFSGYDYTNIPWFNYRTFIKFAEINVTGMTNAYHMFYECKNLKNIDLKEFDSGNVTNMSCMFARCESLAELDLSNFDTSNVTSMSQMFWDCSSLESLNLNSFDTSNVTDMSYMFQGCESLTSVNVGGFETSNAIYMNNMFENCSRLNSLDLSSFDTIYLENMNGMFYGCSGLCSLDLSGFDGTKIRFDGASIFKGCTGLITINTPINFTQSVVLPAEPTDIWYQIDGTEIKELPKNLNYSIIVKKNEIPVITSSITAVKAKTIYACGDVINTDDLTVVYYDASGVGVEVIDGYATNVNEIDMSTQGKKTLEITYNGMIATVKLTVRANIGGKSGDITWVIDTDGKLTVEGMGDFDNEIPWRKYRADIISAEISVTDMTDASHMFQDCYYLTSVNLEGFDTSKVTNMSYMFSGCSSLTSLDLSRFDTSKVADMEHMFSFCHKLNRLDVSSFDTSNVKDMRAMFANCYRLTHLDVDNFDTSNVADMQEIFTSCRNLESLNLSSFDTSNITAMSGIVNDCTSLTTINTPYNLNCQIPLPRPETTDIWLDEAGNEYEELPQNLDHSILIKKNEIPIVSAIKAIKTKTDYVRGDIINIDDLTVTYYDADSIARELEKSEYTTNAVEIDMSTAGEKTLVITYGELTTTIELTVTGENIILLSGDNAIITLSDTYNYVYDGKVKTPEVMVTYTASGNTVSGNTVSGNSANKSSITLEQEKDYTVTYENNINAFEDRTDLETAQDAPRVIITGQNKYSGTLSKAFSIQKAAAPEAEEQVIYIKDYTMAHEGCTLDLSGCFADYNDKTGYTVGNPVEDDTIIGSVLSGKPSIDEKGMLTYSTDAGKIGDFVVIPIEVSFSNHRDAVINVKIVMEKGNGDGDDQIETMLVPTAAPESGRQLIAGSEVTLACETAGAEIYYTISDNRKDLTDPTKDSIKYVAPIIVNTDVYIRAVAIKGSNQSKFIDLHYTVADASDKVLKPYTIPGQGAVEKGTKVELKCDTLDAEIYFTICGNADIIGAVPVDDEHKYTEPIEITKDMAIKAIAKKDGMKDSDYAAFVYRINITLDAPVAEPASGTVDQGSYISLKADSDANIYYTMDKTDPVTSGSAKLYESRIRVDGNSGSAIVIKAVTEKKGIYSETVTFTYTISESSVKGLQVMLAGSEEFIYTGSPITPAVIVTNNGEELVEGEDYTVRYSNNIKAADKSASKAPKITVTGKGNLTKNRSITFTIKPKYIGDEEEVMGGSIVVVSGKTAEPILFYDGVKLTAKDFDNPNAKKKYDKDETITITGKGNFEGTRDIDVRVVDKKDMKKFTVVIDNNALKREPLIYDGEEKTLDGYFEVYDTADKSSPLEEYSDYAVIYPKNNINAGKVKFTVVGLGEYYGTVTKAYTIKPRVIKTEDDGGMDVNVNDGDEYPFTGGSVTIPDLTVTCDGDVLTLGKDYKVTYSNNKKICTNNKAKCKISFIGNYKGSKALVRKFNITTAVMDDVDKINETLSVAVADMVYTGRPGAYKSIPYVTVNGVLLKSSDYNVSYYKDIDREQVLDGKTASSSVDLADSDKQTVYMKIEGKGNYEGILTAEYDVYKLTEGSIDLSKAKVTIVGGNKVEYTGEGAAPDIEIKYKSDSGWKTIDADDIGTYVTVTYINNVNKGRATVMVNGNGDRYMGSKTTTFSIVSKSMKQ